MRWMPIAAIALGGALLAAGCVLPLVILRPALRPAGLGAPMAAAPSIHASLRALEDALQVSVIDCAFPGSEGTEVQVHDTYLVAGRTGGTGAARLLLAVAAVSICLAAARRRIAARIASGALAAAVAFLFVGVGADHVGASTQEPATWTAYPPLSGVSSDPFVIWWPAWIALVAGAALVAASTFPPRREEPAPEAPPIP